MSSNPFSVFDWKYGLTKVDVTAGYTTTDGSWIPEVTTETTIQGHVSDLTLEELKFADPALITAGARKLTVEQSYGLQIGDRVAITEVDTTVTNWFIHSKVSFSGLMARYIKSSRDTFLLRRIT